LVAARKAVKDADTLGASIDQAFQANDYLVAYFLIGDLKAKLKSVQLEDPAKYGDDRATQTEAVFEATTAEKDAKTKADQKTAAQNAAQKNVDDAWAKRQDTIIRRIRQGATASTDGPV
jgi:hypothetical protein